MADIREEREARIRVLEQRLAKRHPVGVRAPVALFAILAAGVVWWMNRLDIAYAFSSREPIVLGQEGDYRFGELRSNRYAQIHGVPSVRGVYGLQEGKPFVGVGLRDTPVVVWRPALATEAWKPGQTPPPPDQRPFKVGGRLLSEDDARRYAQAFPQLQSWGEVHPINGKLWILLEGQRPGEDYWMMALPALLVAVIALNVWFLWQLFAARRAVRAAP